MVASLGSWRGREPSSAEWTRLEHCLCPACQQYGLEGIKASGKEGFCVRATHNLWVLLNEAELIARHLFDGSYREWVQGHLDNTTYRPIIMELVMSQATES